MANTSSANRLEMRRNGETGGRSMGVYLLNGMHSEDFLRDFEHSPKTNPHFRAEDCVETVAVTGSLVVQEVRELDEVEQGS